MTRPGARAVVLSVVLFLLIGLAQSALAAVGEDTPVFGGLHALGGILSLGIAGLLYTWARRLR